MANQFRSRKSLASFIRSQMIDNDDSQLIEVKACMLKYARQIVKSKILSGALVKSNGVYIY